jgi:hypothetical protein
VKFNPVMKRLRLFSLEEIQWKMKTKGRGAAQGRVCDQHTEERLWVPSAALGKIKILPVT